MGGVGHAAASGWTTPAAAMRPSSITTRRSSGWRRRGWRPTVSVIVMALLLFAVVTMLIASLFFVLRFSWLYIALLGFQAPGAARELAWGWLVGMFKDLATVAGMSFVISYLMLGMSAYLNADGLPLAQRFAVLIIMALAMFLYRRRILAGIAHLTDRLRAEAASLRPGSRGGRAGSRLRRRWRRRHGGGRHVRLRRRPAGTRSRHGRPRLDRLRRRAHRPQAPRAPAQGAACPGEVVMIVDRRLVAAVALAAVVIVLGVAAITGRTSRDATSPTNVPAPATPPTPAAAAAISVASHPAVRTGVEPDANAATGLDIGADVAG